MSNTVDVEALVARREAWEAWDAPENSDFMTRGSLAQAAFYAGYTAAATALSTLAKERDRRMPPLVSGELEQTLAAVSEQVKSLQSALLASESQLAKMADALKPFVDAFDCAFRKYVKRYADAEIGARIFNKMPNHWPMESLAFSMGDFRAAREALSTAPAAREVGVTGDAQGTMAEIALIVGEWRSGPELSGSALARIRSCLTTEAPAVTPEIARLTQELEAERRRSDMMRVQRDGHAATLATRDAEIVKAVVEPLPSAHEIEAVINTYVRVRVDYPNDMTRVEILGRGTAASMIATDIRARARDGQAEERGQTPTVEVIEIRKGERG